MATAISRDHLHARIRILSRDLDEEKIIGIMGRIDQPLEEKKEKFITSTLEKKSKEYNKEFEKPNRSFDKNNELEKVILLSKDKKIKIVISFFYQDLTATFSLRSNKPNMDLLEGPTEDSIQIKF